MKSAHANNKQYCAEVIESSLPSFLAQTWHWDKVPAFGSLIAAHVGASTVFGIVSHIQTGSIDPTRYPFAYQKTEEELLKEQPQIFEFLRTTFTCIITGYQENARYNYLVFPEPLKIHTLLRPATHQESMAFFRAEQYMTLLFGGTQSPSVLDELFLAVMRYQIVLGILDEDAIAHAVSTFSFIIGNDYKRLKLVLQRLQMFLLSSK